MTNFLQSKANEKTWHTFCQNGKQQTGPRGKEHYNYYIGQLIQGLSNNVLLNRFGTKTKQKFFFKGVTQHMKFLFLFIQYIACPKLTCNSLQYTRMLDNA